MKRGFIAGNFDLLHPGYIKLFKEAKSKCDEFSVLLHIDPSLERPEKHTPILSLRERSDMLKSIKYIDVIKYYATEDELISIIEEEGFNIRFLGDDYKNKRYTGDYLDIQVIYIDRSHGWSTTKLKKLINGNNNIT